MVLRWVTEEGWKAWLIFRQVKVGRQRLDQRDVHQRQSMVGIREVGRTWPCNVYLTYVVMQFGKDLTLPSIDSTLYSKRHVF